MRILLILGMLLMPGLAFANGDIIFGTPPRPPEPQYGPQEFFYPNIMVAPGLQPFGPNGLNGPRPPKPPKPGKPGHHPGWEPGQPGWGNSAPPQPPRGPKPSFGKNQMITSPSGVRMNPHGVMPRGSFH